MIVPRVPHPTNEGFEYNGESNGSSEGLPELLHLERCRASRSELEVTLSRGAVGNAAGAPQRLVHKVQQVK